MPAKTIPKRELATRIAERYGWENHRTLATIQAFLDAVIEELVKGNRLEFRDFGVLETVMRKKRMGLNPKTRLPVVVPPKRAVRFKAGYQLRQRLSERGTAR